MFRTSKSTGLALSVAVLLSQSVAFADEMSSTSVKTETPLGSASSSVKVKSNASGVSKEVQTANSDAVESNKTTYRAEAGAAGAKVEEEKSGVRANADGSVTAGSKKESHEVGIGGSAHKKSSASTTVDANGSASTVKQVKETVNP